MTNSENTVFAAKRLLVRTKGGCVAFFMLRLSVCFVTYAAELDTCFNFVCVCVCVGNVK